MALKRKISKEVFDKLSEDLKKEYKEQDGEYVIDLEGSDDNQSLLNAKQYEKDARKAAEAKVKELQKLIDDSKDDSSRSKGDVDALDKSWTEKFNKQKSEFETKIETQKAFISKGLVDNVALNLASKLSKSPSLLVPIIKSRLKADFDGDVPTTKVLDASGSLSALTISDLEKEIMTNEEYKPILIGSKASGGGTSGGDNNPNNSSANAKGKIEGSLIGKTPREIAEHMKSKQNQQE